MKKNLYLTLLFVFMVATSIAQGPVVYLPLDSDLKDASGNALDATDAGTAPTVFVDDAVRGKVAYFEKAAHATLPKVDKLRFGAGQDFAFSFWVKGAPAQYDPAIFGNKDWNSGRNKGFVVYSDASVLAGSNNFGVNFSDGPTDQGGSHNRLYWQAFPNGAPNVIDDAWHFVAMSFDRSDTLRVWIDGEAQYSAVDLKLTPGMGYDDVKDYPITIGQDGTGTYANDMPVYFDDIRIWNRTITEKDVQQAFAPLSGSLVYLPLDSDLKDASGNDLNATDAGAAPTVFVDDAKRGKVAYFEKVAHATLPKVDKLRFGPGQDFAFSFWVKGAPVASDPGIFGNKDWNSGRNKGFIVYSDKSINPGANNFAVNFSDGATEQGGSHNRLYWQAFPNGAPDVIDDTWHFVAMSFDRDDTLRVWIDGEAQYSNIDLKLTPGMGYDNDKDYPITIGQDGTGTYAEDMPVYFDEIRIWNRTLATAEVMSIYDATKVVTGISKLETALPNTSVFPNPANGVVNLKFNMNDSGNAHIFIYNNTGALVKGSTQSAVAGQNVTTFDVKGWVPGIYYVRVVSVSGSESVRLVVF